MWSTSEQYAFGWFVPIFALGLFWKRWLDRPAASVRPAEIDGYALISLCLLGLLLLPVRVILEVNQDWALFSWLLALITVGLTVYAVYLLGGWPWVKHFAFPVCFILVAVRWPYRIENSLTYRLMGVVASWTVELLGWLNIPATQNGNLIEVATGTVGVDEACSGIRSFQSSLMASLLMGELYQLRVWARASLVGMALLLAFGLNVCRTLFLTWQANAHGLSAIEKWHDTAGLSITVGCFFCLWAIARLICRRQTTDDGRRATDQGPKVDSGERKAEIAITAQLQPSLRRYLVAVGLWSVVCIGVTEAWYRGHESKRVPTAMWWAHFPTNSPGASEIPMSKLARSKLKYDEGSTLSWEEPDGSKWSAFCFRWNAGVATSRMSARDHRPEYCLGGSGYNCQADLGIRYLPAQGLELPFRTYTFERAGVVLYVFHCLWEDGAAKQNGFGTSKYLDRLETVLEGKRCLGQQTLEIIVSGYASMDEAEAAFRQRLPNLIQLGAAPDVIASQERDGEW
jgi:exosortase